MSGDAGDVRQIPTTSEMLKQDPSGPVLLPGIPDLFRFSIDGIEVSQGIQYYRASRHLTDSDDRWIDNSVALVADKPAWVRVYVRAGLLSEEIPGVTGTLVVLKRRFGLDYRPIATLEPLPPGSVTARPSPDYATERGALFWTLNFLLRADLMCGNLELVARVKTPDGLKAAWTEKIDVTLRQTLRLAGIMVSYDGPASSAKNAPNVTLAAPTMADLRTTSAWTLLTFPVQSTASYRSAGTIPWTRHLQDAPTEPGGCSPNWFALNEALQEHKVWDGNRPNFIYYGLLPNGIPIGPVHGCSARGANSGSNGNGAAMAHEIGHACGLDHAPCGVSGNSTFPAYEPYDPVNTPRASIGEYGINSGGGAIMPPHTFKDFMSYCGPRWISLWNYARLLHNFNLDPVRICVDHPLWSDFVLPEKQLIPEHWLPDPPPDPGWLKRELVAEPLISVIGVVHSKREIEVRSIVRLEACLDVGSAPKSGLVVELLDDDGKRLTIASLHRLEMQGGCGCGCEGQEASKGPSYPYLFQAFLPDVAPGSQLRIRGADEEEALWSRYAPKRRPAVKDLGARVRKDGTLDLSWVGSWDEGSEAKACLQWSGDGGKSWQALATGLEDGAARVNITGIRAGRVMLRMLMSDGFFTARSRRIAVEIPPRAPEVSVLAPSDGQTLIAGGPMRLWGAASLDSGDAAPEESARWLLDGEKVAGGFDAFVEAPAPGTHKLGLIVSEGRRKSERALEFETIALGDEGEREA